MKSPFYIDYPQESDLKTHKHVCKFCHIPTTIINGLLENHEPHCQYRLQKETELHQEMMKSKHTEIVGGLVDSD